MSDSVSLLPDPHWLDAAQALVDACSHLPSSEERVNFLDSACRALGQQLYPSFLHVLLLIAHRAVPDAQQRVAETLADAIVCGRLPSAPTPNWGRETAIAELHSLGQSHTVALGPIEFVFAEYARPNQDHATLSAVGLDQVLVPLMGLLRQSDRAHQGYCKHLLELAATKLEGGWARSARAALTCYANAWLQCPDDPQEAVNAFIRELASPNGHRDGSRAGTHLFGNPGRMPGGFLPSG